MQSVHRSVNALVVVHGEPPRNGDPVLGPPRNCKNTFRQTLRAAESGVRENVVTLAVHVAYPDGNSRNGDQLVHCRKTERSPGGALAVVQRQGSHGRPGVRLTREHLPSEEGVTVVA